MGKLTFIKRRSPVSLYPLTESTHQRSTLEAVVAMQKAPQGLPRHKQTGATPEGESKRRNKS